MGIGAESQLNHVLVPGPPAPPAARPAVGPHQEFAGRLDEALEKVAQYGFDLEELRNLPDLHLVARNLDSGGEMWGRIKV